VNIITDTQATREQFKSSADLRKAALELYDRILCTIKRANHPAERRTQHKKEISKKFRPALTAVELDEVLGSMNQKVDAYKKCLQSVLNTTLSRIDSSIRSISRETRVTRAVVTGTKRDVKDIKVAVGDHK
jgi:hypothetical protein